jgi:hypothetical protein
MRMLSPHRIESMRDVKGLTGDGVPRRRTRLGDTVMGRLSRLGSYAHGKAGEWEYSRLRCPAPTLSLPVIDSRAEQREACARCGVRERGMGTGIFSWSKREPLVGRRVNKFGAFY